MNKKGDFDFEWLPGFREMMACQNEEQNTQQETDWGNENLQIEALLPPEQLQQEEQRYWKDYEYFIQMLPMVAREVWIVADALLDQYEYKGSPIYSEYPDKVTILKIADMVYDKLKYREEQEMIQADDEEMIRNPYFVEVSLRDAITPFRTLIQVILHWNINHRRQRYYRRQKVFSTQYCKRFLCPQDEYFKRCSDIFSIIFKNAPAFLLRDARLCKSAGEKYRV